MYIINNFQNVIDKKEKITYSICKDKCFCLSSMIFQIVGQSTMLLSQMKEGDYILDFVGPLGAEIRTINTGELNLATDSNTAATAHTCSVNHNRI